MSQAVGNMRVLDLPGSICERDYDAFWEEFTRLVALRPAAISLDCGALRTPASSHIGLLWECSRLCRDHGVRFQLRNPSAAMVRTLEALDLRESFALGMVESMPSDALELDFPSGTVHSYVDHIPLDKEAITHAEERFVAFLQTCGAGASTTHDLRTVVYEIATNVRTHSGLKACDQLELEAGTDANGIMLTFTDTGVPFDPTSGTRQVDPTQAARTGKRRGFGLFMIRKLVDNLDYRRTADGGNILNVHKKWRT